MMVQVWASLAGLGAGVSCGLAVALWMLHGAYRDLRKRDERRAP
jgi:hypothetical protein